MDNMQKYAKKILNFIENKLFAIYFFLSLLYLFCKNIKIEIISMKSKIPIFSFQNNKCKKKSDTLFILGSGASINEISDDMWLHINKHDTFGFNFWIINNHMPDYYMFESPRDINNLMTLKHWLNKRKYNLIKHQTVIILKDFEYGAMGAHDIPDELLDHSSLMKKDNFYGTSQESIKKSIHLVKKFGFFKRNVIYFKRASLITAIYFGWRMGYKKIVLAGIDLNSTEYFYESNQYTNELIPRSNQLKQVHSTVDTSVHPLTVDGLVYLLNDELLKPADVSLFVMNSKSLLASKLPVYEIIV